jgi:hypothetical protein
VAKGVIVVSETFPKAEPAIAAAFFEEWLLMIPNPLPLFPEKIDC